MTSLRRREGDGRFQRHGDHVVAHAVRPAGGREPIAEVAAAIEVLLEEGRTFPPPPEFTAQALIKDDSVYEEAERDFEGFWLQRAKEFVEWFKEPTQSSTVMMTKPIETS